VAGGVRVAAGAGAGVALAAVESANEGMGSWRLPPRRMVAADLVSLVVVASSSGLAGSARAWGGAESSSGLAGSTTRESDEVRPGATRKWEVRGGATRRVCDGAGRRGAARHGEAGGARLGGVASFSFASALLEKGSFWVHDLSLWATQTGECVFCLGAGCWRRSEFP
jgi:hypothetical protein